MKGLLEKSRELDKFNEERERSKLENVAEKSDTTSLAIITKRGELICRICSRMCKTLPEWKRHFERESHQRGLKRLKEKWSEIGESKKGGIGENVEGEVNLSKSPLISVVDNTHILPSKVLHPHSPHDHYHEDDDLLPNEDKLNEDHPINIGSSGTAKVPIGFFDDPKELLVTKLKKEGEEKKAKITQFSEEIRNMGELEKAAKEDSSKEENAEMEKYESELLENIEEFLEDKERIAGMKDMLSGKKRPKGEEDLIKVGAVIPIEEIAGERNGDNLVNIGERKKARKKRKLDDLLTDDLFK